VEEVVVVVMVVAAAVAVAVVVGGAAIVNVPEEDSRERKEHKLAFVRKEPGIFRIYRDREKKKFKFRKLPPSCADVDVAKVPL
jgi:hypothetical protein